MVPRGPWAKARILGLGTHCPGGGGSPPTRMRERVPVPSCPRWALGRLVPVPPPQPENQ